MMLLQIKEATLMVCIHNILITSKWSNPAAGAWRRPAPDHPLGRGLSRRHLRSLAARGLSRRALVSLFPVSSCRQGSGTRLFFVRVRAKLHTSNSYSLYKHTMCLLKKCLSLFSSIMLHVFFCLPKNYAVLMQCARTCSW